MPSDIQNLAMLVDLEWFELMDSKTYLPRQVSSYLSTDISC